MDSKIIKSNKNDDCTGYNYSKKDFFFPPNEIFKTVCMSTDKTMLFLVSFVRCIIIGLIINVLYENNIHKYINYALIFMLTYGAINIFILVGVMLKQQKYKKQFSHN